MKNQIRAALIGTAFMVSCLSARTELPIIKKVKTIKSAKKALRTSLEFFAKIAVEFSPKLVQKAGGKEKAIQLIVKHKQLKIEILFTKQLIANMENDLKKASLVKKAALIVPLNLIKLKVKKQQKKLRKMEEKYPELKKIRPASLLQPFLRGGKLLPEVREVQ